MSLFSLPHLAFLTLAKEEKKKKKKNITEWVRSRKEVERGFAGPQTRALLDGHPW